MNGKDVVKTIHVSKCQTQDFVFFNQEKKRYMEHLTNIKWYTEKDPRDRPQLNKQIKYVGC